MVILTGFLAPYGTTELIVPCSVASLKAAETCYSVIWEDDGLKKSQSRWYRRWSSRTRIATENVKLVHHAHYIKYWGTLKEGLLQFSTALSIPKPSHTIGSIMRFPFQIVAVFNLVSCFSRYLLTQLVFHYQAYLFVTWNFRALGFQLKFLPWALIVLTISIHTCCIKSGFQ